MTHESPKEYRFDEFTLDMLKRRLMRGGVQVPLKPKAFDLLAVLVANNGRLLTKDEIFALVWGDQVVEETNLSVGISAVRRALGETASRPRYITNVSGRGYYFNADFTVATDGVAPPAIEETATKRPARSGRAIYIAAAAVFGAVIIGVVAYALLGRSQTAFTQPLSVTKMVTSGRAVTADISPDGRSYVYARQEPDGANSLWLARVEGGEAIQLRAAGPRSVVQVAVSHDARHVYFVEPEVNTTATATLYRVPALGGLVEKVRDGIGPRISFSSDGQQFAYVRRDGPNKRSVIVLADTVGAGERELAAMESGAGTFGYAVAFSPDGEHVAVPLYFNTFKPGLCDVFVTRLRDGYGSQVTSQAWNTIVSLAWTKDSAAIIAAAGDESEIERQIWYIPFPETAGEPRRLVADSNAYTSLSMSADNASVLAVQTQSFSNIWVAPANDLASAAQVTFDRLGKQSGWNSIDWTADGRVVFTDRTVRSDTVWEIGPDGSGQRQVLPEGRRLESVSLPDEAGFIVYTSNRSGALEIWRAAPGGADAVQLTTGGRNENAHVSPDGRLIVYTAGTGADSRLFVMPAAGGESRRITERVADWARFSPDSRLIAAAYTGDAGLALAIISPDGGPPLKLFPLPETANVRLGMRWTPDGRAVTYRDWQNGIWRQDVNGGPPARLAGLPQEKLFAYAWSRDGRWFAYGRGGTISDVVILSQLK